MDNSSGEVDPSSEKKLFDAESLLIKIELLMQRSLSRRQTAKLFGFMSLLQTKTIDSLPPCANTLFKERKKAAAKKANAILDSLEIENNNNNNNSSSGSGSNSSKNADSSMGGGTLATYSVAGVALESESTAPCVLIDGIPEFELPLTRGAKALGIVTVLKDVAHAIALLCDQGLLEEMSTRMFFSTHSPTPLVTASIKKSVQTLNVFPSKMKVEVIHSHAAIASFLQSKLQLQPPEAEREGLDLFISIKGKNVYISITSLSSSSTSFSSSSSLVRFLHFASFSVPEQQQQRPDNAVAKRIWTHAQVLDDYKSAEAHGLLASEVFGQVRRVWRIGDEGQRLMECLRLEAEAAGGVFPAERGVKWMEDLVLTDRRAEAIGAGNVLRLPN